MSTQLVIIVSALIAFIVLGIGLFFSIKSHEKKKESIKKARKNRHRLTPR